MNIQAKSPASQPIYHRIADWLATQISSGVLKPGDRLPSERKIAAAVGASRMTARQALKFLEHRGLVETRVGRGAFVAAQWSPATAASDADGFQHDAAPPLPTATAYLKELSARLAGLGAANAAAIDAAAEAIVRTAKADGLVYLFGSGHSHMLAEEAHYRAGGLACAVPVLWGPLMLHESAAGSTAFERTAGLAASIFARYPIGADDVLVVISNSGVNAAPVDAAKLARDAGATVIALTAEAYSRELARGRERLAEIASIVLDNGVPAGDAVVSVGEGGLRVGPISTVVGAALLNAVIAEAAARLAAAGAAPPVYVSANVPGAAEANRKLVDRYRRQNPHL